MKTVTLQELSELVSGKVSGNRSLRISSFNSLELAAPGELTFIINSKMAEQLAASRASAAVVPLDFPDTDISVIRVKNPDLAAARIHNYLLEEPFAASGIHSTAVIGADCEMSREISIHAHVSIGNRVRIGRRVTLHPGVVLGDDVRIGDDCVLHANAVVACGCILGDRVVLHHGAVIGSDGFGFTTDPDSGCHVSKPQVGTVRLGDDVQVGANSCVDRAAFGETWVKNGVRIDNQVMVAHNCIIGENSILVGQVGIAGSTILGRNVVLGARSGVAGHLTLEDGVMVAAMAGVHSNLKRGTVVGGIPAIDIKKWGRAAAAFARLPQLIREMRGLRRQVKQLQAISDKESEKDNE